MGLLIIIGLTSLSGFAPYIDEYMKPKPTTQPSVVAIVTPTPTSKPVVKGASTATINDPQIDCLGPDGKYFKTTKVECDKFNSSWGRSNQPVQVTNQNSPTSSKKYVCQITSSGYIVYTKDANECYSMQASDFNQSLKNTNCKTQSDSNLRACLSPCDQSYEEGKSMCSWAYTGANASIANDTSKYGECLDENLTIWQGCTKPCYDKSIAEFNSCIK